MQCRESADLQDIKRLTRLIFMRAQPKRLGTQVISGGMLAALAQAYVDAINHGAVPTIATAWQVKRPPACYSSCDALNTFCSDWCCGQQLLNSLQCLRFEICCMAFRGWQRRSAAELQTLQRRPTTGLSTSQLSVTPPASTPSTGGAWRWHIERTMKAP